MSRDRNAELDREIAEALASYAGGAPHGVDTVQPRRLAGQPLSSRGAPPPHGMDTVRPRRPGTSHAKKKESPWRPGEAALFWAGPTGWRPVRIEGVTAAGKPQIIHPLTGKLTVVQARASLEKASSARNHARRQKLDPHEAKQRLKAAGVDFSRDFHALPSRQVQLLVDTARAAGYRKRKDAPGSTARMYFQYLSRLR